MLSQPFDSGFLKLDMTAEGGVVDDIFQSITLKQEIVYISVFEQNWGKKKKNKKIKIEKKR